MKTHFKIAIIVIVMIGFMSNTFAQSNYFNITKDSPQFTHGAANQVVYIDMGDIQFWGYMEITLTSSWSHQNSVGKYTKRYQIGKNVGHLYTATSEVPTVFGLISNQWKLGEAFVDTNNHLKIPIYHLVTTGNRLAINISGISLTAFDKNLITITTPATIANNETRDYVTYKSQVNILDKVGIGTTNPVSKLQVDGNIAFGPQGGTVMPSLSRETSQGGLLISRVNVSDGSLVNNLMIIKGNGDVGIGTNDPQGFKLGVKGKIAAEEVKVATYNNWPDYVFKSNYNLPTLNEVESHIHKNGHLKDIPSAEKIKKEGFFLGDMNAKLLQKIEELTLYTIAQEKQLKAQEEKIKALENQTKEIEKLKAMVNQLLDNK